MHKYHDMLSPKTLNPMQMCCKKRKYIKCNIITMDIIFFNLIHKYIMFLKKMLCICAKEILISIVKVILFPIHAIISIQII